MNNGHTKSAARLLVMDRRLYRRYFGHVCPACENGFILDELVVTARARSSRKVFHHGCLTDPKGRPLMKIPASMIGKLSRSFPRFLVSFPDDLKLQKPI